MSLSVKQLFGVYPNMITEVWPKVLPLLQRSLKYCDDKYNEDDVLQALLLGDMQLWITFGINGYIRSFCITEVTHYPRGKRMCILFSAGEALEDCLPHLSVIAEFAKEAGCDSIEIYGRAGWEKVLEKYGYEKIHTVLKKELPKTH